MSIDGHDAQQIDLKVHNRAYIVPVLDNLLKSINNEFGQQFGGPLWSPQVLKSREFLSGSSLHFFNTDIPDDEFTRVKPKVGDIDTQVNKDAEDRIKNQISRYSELMKTKPEKANYYKAQLIHYNPQYILLVFFVQLYHILLYQQYNYIE
jgi:hypothetical protein